MKESSEISALFVLLDDPDEDVFTTVSDRIVHYGKNIIPNLEFLWENTTRNDVQERIEMLIHRLHFSDLFVDFKEWKEGGYHDLLLGALLVSKFQYPDFQTAPVLQEIEKIRRNVWLELNSFLTPLEQANVVSSILYNYYNLKGNEINYENPDDFLLHKVMQTKRGNAFSNGLLYLILAEQLNIPVKAINIPKQFVLAFFEKEVSENTPPDYSRARISFYVDSVSGQPFTQNDMDNYFKRIMVPPVATYFKPLNKKRIIQLVLEELANCFDAPDKLYKQKELHQLSEMLND